MHARNAALEISVFAVLALCSCAPASEKACVPNDQKACACLGGVQGYQVCNEEGSAYGVCTGCGSMSSSGSLSSSGSASTSGGSSSSSGSGGSSSSSSSSSGGGGSSRGGASSGGGASSAAPTGPGALDVTFGTGGRTAHVIVAGKSGHGNAAVIQADGKIVVAGDTLAATGSTTDFALARYDVNGNLDAAFGTGGVVSTAFTGGGNDVATAVAMQADGKIVVAGYSDNNYYDFAVARYESNGALDTTFGTGGMAHAKLITTGGWYDSNFATGLVIQADGKIVTVGYAKNTNFQMDFALARWTTTGVLDTTYGVGGIVITNINVDHWSDHANAVVLQSDGKIVVGGNARNATAADDAFVLVRYDSGGALDATFGTAGIVTTDVTPAQADVLTRLALQSDGKILASGYTWTATGHSQVVARYGTSGALDTSFGTGGIVRSDVDVAYPNTYAHSVAVQADGKIVTAGYIGYNLDYRFAVLRYGANGAPDTGFGTAGHQTTYVETGRSCIANVVLVQPGSGKIVAIGYSGGSSSEQHFALARYLP